MPIAIVTGASRGLGRALANELSSRGWSLVVDDRDPGPLNLVRDEIEAGGGAVVAVPGSIADAEHRRSLVSAARGLGGIDLLVNNAGILGPSPQPELADYPLDALAEVLAINVVAQLGMIQAALPALEGRGGTIVNVTSDAAVEPYAGWGGYGAAKAGLDQLTAILAAERPGVRVLAVDPGDMRTRMHQEAFPGEDISDRPPPENVAPGVVALIEGEEPSGRYRVAKVAA